MAEVNVADIEEQRELFEMQMGFPADSEGLDLTDEQVVNFMLLCHKEMVAPEEMKDDDYHEGYEEDYEEDEDGGMKMKVIRIGMDDIPSIMDDMLGHGGLKMEDS